MEGRCRVIAGILMSFFLTLSSSCIESNAQNIVNKALLVEQAKGKAPNVKAYLTGSYTSDNMKAAGTVSGTTLTQEGNIVPFDESGEGIRYIVLFDNSGSINIKQFEEAKVQLSNMRKSLRNSDEMQIFTVGTTDISAEKRDVMGRVACATETDKLASDCEAIESIEYIPGVESRTILYRSLSEVLEEQAGQADIEKNRTVIILITDGEDDSDELKGRNNDRNATLVNVQKTSIPVYGILLNSTARKPNEEKIKFTKNSILNASNGNGYYYNCSDKEDADIVSEAFKTIEQVLREQTYVIYMAAENNRTVDGEAELKLVVNGQAVDTVLFDYSNYEKDDTAPIVVGIVEKEGRNTISLTLEDENGVNISDAGDIAHYIVRRESDDKSWTVNQVNVNQDGTSAIVTLTMNEENFLNGTYELIIDGIRDESQDVNSMKEVKISFEVDDGLDPGTVARKDFLQKYWWIGLIILVAALGTIGLIFLRKKVVKIVEVDGSELNKADSKLIRLTITDRLGTTREVEYNVEGSVFIGRSDICEIFFDDDRLSKQHFVIEVTKMGCYIEDLDSTNKTYVNGVKVTNKRLLLDGDVITAGRETFVIHLDKNELMDEFPAEE